MRKCKVILQIVIPFIIITFISESSCNGQIPPDKQQHFAAGYLIGFSTSVITVGQKPLKSLVWDVGIATLIGSAKEAYDMTGKGTPEIKDLVYTIGGSLLGYGVIQAFKKFPERKNG
jgi:uncharacterized protein YfiM (DUF2279 family)